MALTPEQEQAFVSRMKQFEAPQNDFLTSVASMPQDQAVKILRLSALAGVDPEVAAANPNATVQNLIGAVDFEDVDKFAPKTYRFLSDPFHMAVTRTPENVKTLSTLEGLYTGLFNEGPKAVVRSLINSVKGLAESSVYSSLKHNIPFADEQIIGGNTAYGSQPAPGRPITTVADFRPETVTERMVKSGWLKAGNYNFKGLKINIAGKEYDTAQYAMDIGTMIPQVIGQMAATAYGGPVAGGGFMVGQIGGSQYEKLTNEDNVAPDRAFVSAIADALMQAPLEQFGMSKVMRKIPANSARAIKAKKILEGAFTEGITEWLQQYPEAATEIWAKNPGMTAEQMGRQFADEFLKTTAEGVYQGLVALPLGGLGGAIHTAVQKSAAEAYVQRREQIQKVLASSEIHKVSPELTERFLGSIGQDEKTYVAPEALSVLFQSDPQLVEKLGVTANDIIEAERHGQMVEVDTAKYDTVSADHPEVHQKLKDDISPNSEGTTVRRINERNKQDLGEAIKEQAAKADEFRSAQNDLYSKMTKAGVNTQQAREIITALTANARVMNPENPAQYLQDNAPQFRKAKEVPTNLLARVKALMQPVNADINPHSMVNVVDLSQALPNQQFVSEREVLHHLQELAAKNEALPTADQKAIIEILPKDVRHVVYSSRKGHVRFDQILSKKSGILSIGDLIKNAVLIESMPNRKADAKPDVRAYHRFYVPVSVGDNVLTVRLVAKEENGAITLDPSAVSLYDVIVEDKKTKPSAAEGINSQDANRPLGAARKASKISIQQMLSGVKDAYGVNYFQGDRGMIHWEQGRAIITLFEGKSNASTIIHETIGHYFVVNLIEQGSLDTSPEWLKKDREAALNFAGISDWNVANDVEKKEALEKLAQAAEAYIMEGNAPSIETRGMFQRFADWLAEVYRNVKLAVQLTPEIRSVFDRMLATQEEIDHMEAVEGYLQRIPQDVFQSLTEGQKRDLERMLDNTRERAEAQVRARMMRLLRADNRALLAEEEKRATEEITKEVMAQPLYEAEQTIAGTFKRKAKQIARAYIGNTPLTVGEAVMTPLETLEVIRQSALNRGDYTTAEMMQKQIDRMNEDNPPQVKELSHDQQAEFEFIADLHSFSSGSELAQNLLAYNSSKVTIENRVEEHMNQFKDTLDDPVRLEQDARESMYSDDGALLVAAEQQIINEKLGQVISREESRKAMARRREIAKQSAADAMGKMTLDKAMRLQTWIASERRAAEKAAKALEKGDLELAQEQKGIQLYNHAMVMESLRIRREFERTEKYLRRQQRSDIKTWKKEEHFFQAAELLRRFGYLRTDYDQLNKRETLSDWSQRMDDTMDAVEIAPWLYDESFENVPRQLTAGQFKDLENAIRNIKRLAQNEDTFLKLFNKADIADAIRETNDRLDQLPNKYVPTPEEDATVLASIRKGARQYLFSLKKFTQLVNEMDRNKDFGFFYNLLYDGAYRAANDVSDIIQQLEKRQNGDFESIYSKEDRKSLTRQQYYAELGATVSKQYLIEMASHVGTQSNKFKLFSVPPIGLENSRLWVRESIEATERNIMEFLGRNLTEQDWKYVQAGWDNINSLFSRADELQRRVTGFGMEKVEALPFSVTLADGSELSMRGGYFPLKEDPRSSIRAEQREEESKPLYTERVRPFQPATATGYTHARTGATYPLDLNPANRFRHMQSVAHDIAFREIITDLRRLIRNKEFKTVIERKFGQEGYRGIVDFVASAATSKTEASSAGIKWLNDTANFLRKKTVAAVLMFRLKTLVQNFANPFLYGNAVDGFSHLDAVSAMLNRGVMGYWSSPGQAREFVFGKSAFMRDKLTTPDFILHEFLDKAKGKEDPFVKWGATLLAETDNITNIPMWMEAYHKQIDAGATEYEAIRFADTLIDRATGSGRKIDTASLLRGNAVERLFTMFQTFMNTQYNAWAREYSIFMAEKDIARLTSFVASRWLLFVIASAFLGGDTPDDDKNKYAEGWAKQILSYPLGLLPIVGDAAKVALDKSLGVQSYGVRLSAVESTLEMPGKIAENIKGYGEGKRELADVLEVAAQAGSFLKPYPDQFNDWFFNAYDILFNDMEAKPVDLLKRRPKKER